MKGKHVFRGIRRPLTLADVFQRVTPEPNTGCWLWLGPMTTRGYAQVTYQSKTHIVSRLTYELAHGPLASGVFACHRCDTPLCVNPDHLFAGTAKDNIRDMWRKGREYLPWLSHRDRSWCQRRLHRMTPENTILKANDAHQCRACKYTVENERRRRVAAQRRSVA